MKHKPINRQTMLDAMLSEDAWQRTVIDWAHLGGWLVYHVHDSREQEWGTDRGFPDLVLLRPPLVLFVELKKGGGRVTTDQAKWLDQLARVEHSSAVVWMPHDEQSVREILLGHVLRRAADGP